MSNAPKVTIIEPIHQRIQDESAAPAAKVRVAAYARVSTEQDEQQSSFAAQVDYYTRYIQSNPNWDFVGIFSDAGITGTNTKSRDGFNKMVDCALRGEIEILSAILIQAHDEPSVFTQCLPACMRKAPPIGEAFSSLCFMLSFPLRWGA